MRGKNGSSVKVGGLGINAKTATLMRLLFVNKILASTYSPEYELSTISGAGLNCSVREGKR